MSSPMTTTMLGGLAAVCAEATPLNVSGSARAVVIRSFLNIDVSSSSLDLEPTQQRTLTSQEPGHGRSRRAFRRKCSVDQRRRKFRQQWRGVRRYPNVSEISESPPKFRRASRVAARSRSARLTPYPAVLRGNSRRAPSASRVGALLAKTTRSLRYPPWRRRRKEQNLDRFLHADRGTG